ncbi:MAG: membrane protein insertase YidC [Planctomycetota bacterium]|jgi:YidC/Oxa1 family membrane protein insertase
MEKRLAIALVLCLLWIVFTQLFLIEPPEPQEGQGPDSQPGVSDYSTGDEDAGTSDLTDPRAAGTGEITSDKKDDVVPGQESYDHTGELAVEEFDVDTDIFRGIFSNRGGVLRSLSFKDYFINPEVLDDVQAMDDPKNWLEILREVRVDTPSFALREMSSPRYHLDEVCWEHTITSLDSNGREILFTYRTPDGLIFKKAFRFLMGGFHIDIDLSVENRNPALDKKLQLVFEGPCGIDDRKRAAFTMGPMACLFTLDRGKGGRNYELDTFAAAELVKASHSWNRRSGGDMIFAGLANNYFALLVKPMEGKMVSQVTFHALENSAKVLPRIMGYEARYGLPPPPRTLAEFKGDALDNVKADFLLSAKMPQPGERASQSFMFFAGPKSANLTALPEYHDFHALIEDSYGSTMRWINVALIGILKFFHSIFGNWGMAIICLTFLVKALLFPLNRVQQVSMHTYSEQMKKLKPKLDELKKKYKNNKKKFNEAQMKLMKEEGLRPPLMGCLLVFLQFPVFIGLFQVLRTAFELRHSPFCLWIQDLSQPDMLCPLPFTIPLLGWDMLNVLPIGMTVAFYYQQKMMPRPAGNDPQAEQMMKIMKFMPIFFGFILYNYAAGLSLYWMTSNLISIFEYKVIRKKFPVAAAASPAKA